MKKNTTAKTRPVQIAVVVSDLHCGSHVGLSHPDAELESGNVVGFGSNVIQEWLWACWQLGTKQAVDHCGGDPFALVVNGDATEGVHHGGSQIIAQKIEEHAAIAFKCLAPLAEKARATFIVKGTECHTRDIEHRLAQQLGAEHGKARDKWLLEIHGTLCDFAHHVATTSRRYLEAGGLSIAMGNARQNYLDAGQRAPRVFMRGHRHCGGWYSSGHAAIGVTGGFQMLTRHGFKVVTDSIPHPSIIVLDWRGLPKDSIPNAKLIKFDPPAAETVRV